MYSKPSDEVLAYANKEIQFQCRKLLEEGSLPKHDEEDFCNEMLNQVLKNYKRHDPKLGGMKTFVSSIIESKIKTYLRDRSSAKERKWRDRISLDKERDENESDIDSGHQFESSSPSVERVEQQQRLSQAIESLSPELREIAVRLTKEGKRELAAALGISRQKLNGKIAKIAMHFKNFGLDQ